MKPLNRKIYILAIAVLLGTLTVSQNHSVLTVTGDFIRDTDSNIFQEIAVLKSKNADLRHEVADLEGIVNQLGNRSTALKAVEDEIKRYKKLSGNFPIFGPGVVLTIDAELTIPWMIDLINEFFNNGAQAVSVNNIRIINKNIGFDSLPKGRVLLSGSVIRPPYEFKAIGEPDKLLEFMNLPGSVLAKIKPAFPQAKIDAVAREIIQMD